MEKAAMRHVPDEAALERYRREVAVKLQNYRALNAVCKKGQIVFAGSSLREEFPIAEFVQNDTLPICVYNRGVSGAVTGDLISYLDVVVLGLAPSKVFLNIGTNDLSDPVFEVEALSSRYEIILQKIAEHLPETEVYMMAFYPMNEGAAGGSAFGGRTNERIARANTVLCALAGHTPRCRYIDVNQGLYDKNGALRAEFTYDGVHMYVAAYEIVYRNLRRYLKGE